jgi:hypothetical protein
MASTPNQRFVAERAALRPTRQRRIDRRTEGDLS